MSPQQQEYREILSDCETSVVFGDERGTFMTLLSSFEEKEKYNIDWESMVRKMKKWLVKSDKGWSCVQVNLLEEIQKGKASTLSHEIAGRKIGFKLFKCRNVMTSSRQDARQIIRLIFAIDQLNGNIILCDIYTKKQRNEYDETIVSNALMEYPVYMAQAKNRYQYQKNSNVKEKEEMYASNKDALISEIKMKLEHVDKHILQSLYTTLTSDISEVGMELGRIYEHIAKTQVSTNQSIGEIITTYKDQAEKRLTKAQIKTLEKSHKKQKEEIESMKNENTQLKMQIKTAMDEVHTVQQRLAQAESKLHKYETMEKLLAQNSLVQDVAKLQLTKEEQQRYRGLLHYAIKQDKRGWKIQNSSLIDFIKNIYESIFQKRKK